MKPAHGIAELQLITQLLLDARLQDLRHAAEARDRSLMQYDALAAAEDPGDLPVVLAGTVGLAYQRWADQRRADLNAVIARQTVDWMAARSAASTAFGRVQALNAALDRQKR